MTFDPVPWLQKFRSASKRGNGFRELRAEIFQETVQLVSSGAYHLNGHEIGIDNRKVWTEFFEAIPRLSDPPRFERTSVSVIEADCLETAALMIQAGYEPCVLNMASRQNPGGGVLHGAGAQEENLFRRSNLFISLYSFAPYAQDYGIARSDKSYPLNRDTGGIYSGGITVFRGSEHSGYCFLKHPFSVSIVSVPAINRPDMERVEGEYQIASPLVEPTRGKIRALLRIAGKYRHDCLVLSAFGCGAFRNPPNHVAALFQEVFRETEFMRQFKLIVFAILDDHNSWQEHNPKGNVLPFLETFGGWRPQDAHPA
jgi:uncharacterized protein (TIGR02452 family)